MKIKSKSMRKKSVAVLAGLAIAGAVGASAASLGGLNSDNLGADAGDVESCDTNGVTVDYVTSFDATVVNPAPTVTLGGYVVDEINLTNIEPGCDTQIYDLTVLGDDAGTPVEENFTGPLDATGSVNIPVGVTLKAEAVTGVALSISGIPVP